MDGLYLYCVREKTEDASGFSVRGIDGRREVFTITYNDLEAVVSRVSLSEYTSGEIQKKAQEDLNWIKEKAVIHENVIEEAMRGIDGFENVIPMRFGTIFKDKAGLKETLDRDCAKLRRLLNRIRGKQEWSVKIYLTDSERFESMVKERNGDIRLKEREMASMAEGMAYFMEEELKETIRNRVNTELDAMLDSLLGKLGEEAAESVRTKNLDREMTGKTDRMVLNAAFLVHGGKVDSFKKTLGGTDEDISTKGLRLEYSGPWPPFNFADWGKGMIDKRDKVTLVDVLDKVLEKGAVINGDMVIRVADVDLVFLGLRLILTSVSKAEELSGRSPGNPEREMTEEDSAYIDNLQKEIKKAEENIPRLINADSPRETEQGLAKLILTIVELIRKLMEKEAFRRVKKGNLHPVEIQKLGLSLKAVKKKIQEIQAIFGIEDEDLNLNLGPLGDLL